MSDKPGKAPHLVTYSESEQDYSAELFDAEYNINDVHPPKDKKEDDSTGASKNVHEPENLTKDSDKEESVGESGKFHIGQNMKDFKKKGRILRMRKLRVRLKRLKVMKIWKRKKVKWKVMERPKVMLD